LNKKSSDLAKLACEIEALENNKRQPLELFELRKKYQELKEDYRKEAETQGNLLKEFK